MSRECEALGAGNGHGWLNGAGVGGDGEGIGPIVGSGYGILDGGHDDGNGGVWLLDAGQCFPVVAVQRQLP